VPVTARLSRRFYDQLGDEAANELVNWLNSVDAEFRSELRERDDRHWERFRTELASSITGLRSELRLEMAELRTELKGEMAALRVELHSELRSHLRWMFTFWVTTLLTLVGLKLL
jgi:hypothetical protein